jgi:NosR/NirI family nitrous oxide reductase transcriptional regulator
MLYHHDQKCPVVIQRRLKREKLAAMTPIPASSPILQPRTKLTLERNHAQPKP